MSASRMTWKLIGVLDLVAGEQQARLPAITSSSQTKRLPVRPRGTSRGQRRGHLDAGEALLAGRVAHDHTARLRLRLEMCGKGRPGSNASGVSTGKHLGLEVGAQPVRSSWSSCGVVQEVDARGGQRRHDLLVEVAPLLLTASAALRARIAASCSRGGHAVGGRGGHAGGDLVLQPRNPDHEELVQVGAEDGQELDAFEQRMPAIVRLFQHAAVELEPAQLAVEVERRVLEICRRR